MILNPVFCTVDAWLTRTGFAQAWLCMEQVGLFFKLSPKFSAQFHWVSSFWKGNGFNSRLVDFQIAAFMGVKNGYFKVKNPFFSSV